MKKILVLVLSLMLICQTALCAGYKAYPTGDGHVVVTGTKNAKFETTFLIKDSTLSKLIDVGQVGMGSDDFSKTLYISSADDLIYTIEIGSESVQVKNVLPSTALAELNAAPANELGGVLDGYNKIFNADLALLSAIVNKEAAYESLAGFEFTSPENVASEYEAALAEILNNEIADALECVSDGKAAQALEKYLGHFDVDTDAYSKIVDKTLVSDFLNGNVYADSAAFESAFADALILAQLCEASGNEFVALARANQAKIGLDLSESANIADIVFAKVDALRFNRFEAMKQAFVEEISLNKLNTATEQTARSVLEAENGVLGILDNVTYAALDEALKDSVCKALVKNDYATIEAAKGEFELIVQRAAADTPVVPNTSSPSKGSGNGYSVSGGSGILPEASQPNGDSKSLPFTDISSAHWSYESVASLYAQNIISGTSDTTFEPDRLVTREEFVKMLVAAFGLYDVSAQNVFSDVSDDDWSVAYLASAYKAGLTTGRGDGSFGKGETLTRQDMAVLAARGAQLSNLELANVASSPFADESQISAYAADSIYTLSGAGIINGVGGGLFSPKTACTRAMAAKVCNELLKLRKVGAGL
ncbi:MAG: S-layer homology domain-containing protein [Clostridia bacterium]|nr:S-layer homology domain-containing protein [Clostridia bacterium]